MKCGKCGKDTNDWIGYPSRNAVMCSACVEQAWLDKVKSQKRPRFHIYMVCPLCGGSAPLDKVECGPWGPATITCGKCGYGIEVRKEFWDAADTIWVEEDLLDPHPMITGAPPACDMYMDNADEWHKTWRRSGK